MSTMLADIARFAFKTRKPFFIAIPVIILFAFCDIIFHGTLLSAEDSIWSKTINPWINIATLVIAAAVWFGEIYQDWKNDLPKRLTVLFQYRTDGEEKYCIVMRCEKAHLADMADVRALGQQIGSQLVNPDEPDRTLSFIAPRVEQSDRNILFDDVDGFFQHQVVTFTLNKLPDNLKSSECKVWRHPFAKEDITVTKI